MTDATFAVFTTCVLTIVALLAGLIVGWSIGDATAGIVVAVGTSAFAFIIGVIGLYHSVGSED